MKCYAIFSLNSFFTSKLLFNFLEIYLSTSHITIPFHDLKWVLSITLLKVYLGLHPRFICESRIQIPCRSDIWIPAIRAPSSQQSSKSSNLLKLQCSNVLSNVWYGSGNSTTLEEVSRFQCLFPNPNCMVCKGHPPPKTRSITHGWITGWWRFFH